MVQRPGKEEIPVLTSQFYDLNWIRMGKHRNPRERIPDGGSDDILEKLFGALSRVGTMLDLFFVIVVPDCPNFQPLGGSVNSRMAQCS